MRTGKAADILRDDANPLEDRPISALLSQVLVAFTIEFDNEFERRMAEAGYAGALLSLVVWSNLMRFLVEGGVSVRDLGAQALASEEQVKLELGCLERWGFVALRADGADDRPIATRVHRRAGRVLRDGWGSGRGIRAGWTVRLTGKGRAASEIWPSLFGEIERRWQSRFGEDTISRLRQILQSLLKEIDLELPQGLPALWDVAGQYPTRRERSSGTLPFVTLLSQLLLTFAVEFDRESSAPLWLCANTLRVVKEQPIAVGDLQRLTGGSPETSGIGWQIKPYVTMERNPASSRGQLVRLTPLGRNVQQRYRELTREIEKRWRAKYGEDKIDRLRNSLQELFLRNNGERSLLSEGLVPAEGTVRAGKQAPALGRRDIGTAARRRMRDLVAQTEMFLRDPGTLPHYPLWDMNRGFGP